MDIQGEKKSETSVFKKYWINLLLEDHRIGNEGIFEFVIVDAPDWVMIVPRTTDGKYLLVQQYRPAWQELSLEFPAGRLIEGEEFEQGAARELTEETGYAANSFELLTEARPISWSRQRMAIYQAENLIYKGQDLDDEEAIEVIAASSEEIREFIRTGKMYQMASILAYNLICNQ